MRSIISFALTAAIAAGCAMAAAIRAESAGSMPEGRAIRAEYLIGGNPAEGVRFDLYRTGSWERETMIWEEPFAGYSMEFDADRSLEIAATLKDLIIRDGLEPMSSIRTDEDGIAPFEGLAPGVYLIIGEEHGDEYDKYVPQPMMCILYDDEDAELTVKHAYTHTGKETINASVLKIWDDNGYAGRPDAATVQLLKDGEAYDEQVLDAGNNWRYAWTGLEAEYRWTVVEKSVPDGYTVSYDASGTRTAITNHRKDDPPPPPPPETTTPAPPPETTTPAPSPETTTTTEPPPEITTTTTAPPPPPATTTPTFNLDDDGTPEGDQDIPYTGVSYMPAIALGVLGAACVLAGLIAYGGKRKGKDR